MAITLPGHKKASVEQDQLLALINSMIDGFLAVDKTGNIELCNGAAMSLLDTNNLKGQKLSDCLHLIDKKARAIDPLQLLGSRTIVSDDYKLRYNDGSTVFLHLNISPLKGSYGNQAEGGWVLLVRDITRDKLIEEERDEFVSVASHELRTPVAIAEGSISNAMLLAERSGANDSVKHSLAAAHDQIIFLSNLINDLSMLSKAERGSIGMEIDTFSPVKLAQSLAHDYDRMAAAKKLAIHFQSQASGQLRSSELYIREILQNFLTNAIKYTEKGSITITVSATGNGFDFEVSDTGIGISKSEQAKIFEKFFRSSDWRVKEVTGTGLGLYVTAKLAKAIGATISINSELNKGSSFMLHVPNIVDPGK